MPRSATLPKEEPVEEDASPSQTLVEAALRGDLAAVSQCLSMILGGLGMVSLRLRSSELILNEEAPPRVRTDCWTRMKATVAALYAAAHSGHEDVVTRLLDAGADVNRKLDIGYATTAAAREGHVNVLNMLLQHGASQDALEDALVEASSLGETETVRLLVSSKMLRTTALSRATVLASLRGFVDVISALLKNGVDVNCTSRVPLESLKPALCLDLDCTPLVAAIVSRQISSVKCLLEAGADVEQLVQIGTWSWNSAIDEERRADAGHGEPYNAAWCAVEYFESTGQILSLIVSQSPNLLGSTLRGRTLFDHANLCQNRNAVSYLRWIGATAKVPKIWWDQIPNAVPPRGIRKRPRPIKVKNYTCRFCRGVDSYVAIAPCKHLCLCLACESNIDKCPLWVVQR